MSVDQRKVVDAIGIEMATGDINLTISDHLDWSDTLGHIYALQEKINDYLDFIESGEILEKYPKSKGRMIKIQIHFKHALPEGDALRFIQQSQAVIRNAGFLLLYKDYENGA